MTLLKWFVLCSWVFVFIFVPLWKCRAHPHRAHLHVYTTLFSKCSAPASCPVSKQQFRGFQCFGLFLVIKASFSGSFSHCGVTTVLDKDLKRLQTANRLLQVGLLPRTDNFQRENADPEGEDFHFPSSTAASSAWKFILRALWAQFFHLLTPSRDK